MFLLNRTQASAVFALFACGAGLSSRALADTPYETVNSRPQFIAQDLGGERAFAFYWALWRSLSEEERARLKATGGGHLLNERSVSFTAVDCESGKVLREDGERFWYWDRIVLDEQDRVVPLAEAPRPDFLYLVMANFNGRLLLGSPRTVGGMKGSIAMSARHVLVDGSVEVQPAEFVRLGEYNRPENKSFFEKFHPYRWPVYYDERAHKPHARQEPALWSRLLSGEVRPVSVSNFSARVEWNACDSTKPIEATAYLPDGGLPPAGPNRPGRNDSGTTDLPIVFVPRK